MLLAISLLACLPIMATLDPSLGKLPAMFWHSAGAKAVVVFLLTYGLYCLFMGDGSETDIVGLVPAVCVGAISYVLFNVPMLGNAVGIILGLVVLAIILDRSAKRLRRQRNTEVVT